jgi:hypothetical protein
VTKALAILGQCAMCGRPQPGMASRKYPHLVTLDYHLHRLPWLGICAGSRSAMPYLIPRPYPGQVVSGA